MNSLSHRLSRRGVQGAYKVRPLLKPTHCITFSPLKWTSAISQGINSLADDNSNSIKVKSLWPSKIKSRS